MSTCDCGLPEVECCRCGVVQVECPGEWDYYRSQFWPHLIRPIHNLKFPHEHLFPPPTPKHSFLINFNAHLPLFSYPYVSPASWCCHWKQGYWCKTKEMLESGTKFRKLEELVGQTASVEVNQWFNGTLFVFIWIHFCIQFNTSIIISKKLDTS